MEVQAMLKNVPMSAQKVREVVRQIQGLPALEAQAVLKVVPRKSARFVSKVLASAIANAEYLRSGGGDSKHWETNKVQQNAGELQQKLENISKRKRKSALKRKLNQYEQFLESTNRLDPEKLWVKEAVAGTATIIKRFQPKARGSAGPILKRRSHIKITLSDE